MRPLLVRQLHALLVCDVDPLLEDGAHDAIEGAQVAEARTAHQVGNFQANPKHYKISKIKTVPHLVEGCE